MPVDLSNWTPPSQRFEEERRRRGSGTLAGAFAKDVLLSPVRAAEGLFDSVYGLVDAVTADALPDIEKGSLSRYISGGEQGPQTLAGGFVTSAMQFAAGFIPVVGWLGKGTGVLSRAAQVAARAEGGARGVSKALAIRLARDTTAGAIVDAVAFDGLSGRLSDLANEHGFGNQLTEFLATEEDDSELEGRLKNAIEGGVLGVVADGLMTVARGARLAKRRNLTPKDRAKWEKYVTDGEVDTAANDFLEKIEETRALDPTGARKEVNDARREAYALPRVDGSPRRTTREVYDQMDRELGLTRDGYLSEQAAVLKRAVNLMAPVIDDIRIEFTQGRGERSNVDLARGVITLAKESAARGKLDREFVHEVFHVLQRFVGKTTRARLTRGFEEAKARALAQDPNLAARLETGNLSRGDYKYVSEDEWFAEMATARTLDEGDAAGLLKGAEPEIASFAKRARLVLQGALEVFRGSYGDDVVQDALAEIRKNGTLQRSEPLPGAPEVARLFAPTEEGADVPAGRYSPELFDRYVRQPLDAMLEANPDAALNRNKQDADFKNENPLNLSHLDNDVLTTQQFVHAFAREIEVRAGGEAPAPLLEKMAQADAFAQSALGLDARAGGLLVLRRMSRDADATAAEVESAVYTFRAQMIATMELSRRVRDDLAKKTVAGIQALSDTDLLTKIAELRGIADALGAITGARRSAGRLLKSFHASVSMRPGVQPEFRSSVHGQKRAASEGAAAPTAPAGETAGPQGAAPAGAAPAATEAAPAAAATGPTEAEAWQALADSNEALARAIEADLNDPTFATARRNEMREAETAARKAIADFDRAVAEAEALAQKTDNANAAAALKEARARRDAAAAELARQARALMGQEETEARRMRAELQRSQASIEDALLRLEESAIRTELSENRARSAAAERQAKKDVAAIAKYASSVERAKLEKVVNEIVRLERQVERDLQRGEAAEAKALLDEARARRDKAAYEVAKQQRELMRQEETVARREQAAATTSAARTQQALDAVDRARAAAEKAQADKERAKAEAATERARAQTAKNANILTPFSEEFDNLEVAAALEKFGGRKAAERMMLLLKRLVDEQGLPFEEQMARIARQADRMHREGGLASFFQDWWYFSLLSHPATMMANVLGNVGTALLAPTQRMLGGATMRALATVAPDSTAAGLRQAGWDGFLSGLDMLAGYGQAIREALSQAGKALRTGEAQLVANHSPFDPGTPDLGVKLEEPNEIVLRKVPDGGSVIFQTLRSVVSIKGPGRILQATDEFFKQMSYRAIVYADAMFEARRSGLGENKEALGAFVQQRLETTVLDGHAATVDNLYTHFETKLRTQYPGIEQEPAKLREAVKAAIADFQEKNPDAGPMAQRALRLAETMTLTNSLGDRLLLERLSRSAQSLVNTNPLLRFFIPFVRTPANLMLMGLDNTIGTTQMRRGADLLATAFPWFGKVYDNPAVLKRLGIDPDHTFARSLKDIQYGQIRNLTSQDPALMAEQVGKLTTAVGLGLSVWGLVSGGLLTGGGPDDPQAREALKQRGWLPYSIKLGDTYVSYVRLDPIASMVGMFADVFDYARFNDDESIETTELMGGVVSALANQITEKTYFQGLANLLEMVQDPRKSEQVFQSFGATIAAPGILKAVRDVSEVPGFDDPALRELHGLVQRWKDRLPGLSGTLPQRRNFLGEPVSRYSNALEAFTNAWLPVDFSTVKDDTIRRELDELGYAFMPPSGVRGGIDLHKIRVGSTTAYDRWLELTGTLRIGGRTLRQEMARVIGSRAYQRASPKSTPDLESPRIGMLRSVQERYRTRAYMELMGESREVRSARRLLDSRRVLRQHGVVV